MADGTAAGATGGSEVRRPLVLAHRGAQRAAPENTLAAFAAARAQGADGVELDVRSTRDGVLVVHHDPRPPGGPVLAAVDLRELRAAYPTIPTLTEALDACRTMLVNVEIKHRVGDPDDRSPVLADLVVALLRARDGRDRVLVSSFRLPTLDRVRALAPDVPTALLFGFGGDPWRALERASRGGHAAIHPPLRSMGRRRGPRFAARARELGLAVNVWTVNDAADVVRMAALGVDGVVTDVPEVARDALGARGPGPGSAQDGGGSTMPSASDT